MSFREQTIPFDGPENLVTLTPQVLRHSILLYVRSLTPDLNTWDHDPPLTHGSANISPIVLSHTFSQNACDVGSYTDVHQMYIPGVLGNKTPLLPSYFL